MKSGIKILLFLISGLVFFAAVDAHKLVKKFSSEEIEYVEIKIEEKETGNGHKKLAVTTFLSVNNIHKLLFGNHFWKAPLSNIGEYFSIEFGHLKVPEKFLLFSQLRICS
ncbi:MAG: hypothetical protein D6707_07960 [Bacteroidetes bacterium]|nr:MAG: hypothetical protein D6707_07960 [Bacteroidota bacterium]